MDITEKILVDGNDLIASFMEHKPAYEHQLSQSYHTEWNLMMPVLEKIGGIGHTMYSISTKRCGITPVIYELISDSMKFYANINMKGDTTLEAVWLAVTTFLRWYKQKVKRGNNETSRI